MRRTTTPEKESPPSTKRVRRGNLDDQQAFRVAVATAALKLYQAQGLTGVTMRAVAAEVGSSAMALYRYYDGKSALLVALWDHVLVELVDAMRAALARESAPPRRLHASMDAYLRYFEQHTDHFRLLYMTEQTTGADSSAALKVTPAYRQMVEMSREIDREHAAALGLAPSVAQLRLALQLRLTLCIGYLHSRIVNQRIAWQDGNALRDQVLASAQLGAERCYSAVLETAA